jgi:hypothetical protein
MTDPKVPGREMARLETLASRQKSLFVVAQIGALLGLGCVIALPRLLGESYDVLSAILATSLFLGVIAILVHLTCFQRCPRCVGWIVIPKCPACGLKLGKGGRSA